MLESLQKIEDALVRVESSVLVVCVLLMLALAGYNVFYRNALIPYQNYLRTSGPPVSDSAESETEGEGGTREEGDSKRDGAESESDDGAEGFGGGFGGGGEESGDEESDESGGFEGGFGAGENESEDSAEGFGGGFGSPDDESEPSSEDETEGFGGGFGGGEKEAKGGSAESATESAEAREERTEPPSDEEPVGGPPKEGTFAAWLIDFIDTIKLAWIDILLRQLVLIVGFLGAMVASRRREHITIDAVGQFLEGRAKHGVDALTGLVASGVCVFLAYSGWELVKIGLKWPRDLLPFAQEWTFQLMFPVGFGLMALHFLLRSVESGWAAYRDEPVEEEVEQLDLDDSGEGNPEDSDEIDTDDEGAEA